MKKVFLHGELGSKFGSSWNLDVESCSEAIRALFCNNPDIEKYVYKKESEGIFYTAGYEKNSPIDNQKEVGLSTTRDIHIFPAPAGSMASMLMAGVSSLIGGAIQSKIDKTFEKVDGSPLKVQSKSYLIQGQDNRFSQGENVPLGYGRMKLGSNVISSSTLNYEWDKKDGVILNIGGVHSILPEYEWVNYNVDLSNPIVVDTADGNIEFSQTKSRGKNARTSESFGAPDSLYGAFIKGEQQRKEIMRNVRREGNSLGGYLYYEYNYFKGFDRESLERMGNMFGEANWEPSTFFEPQEIYVLGSNVGKSSCVALQSMPYREDDENKPTSAESRFYPILFNERETYQQNARLVGRRYKGNNKDSGIGWNLLESISVYKSVDLLCEGPVDGFYGMIDGQGNDSYTPKKGNTDAYLQGVHLDDVPVVEVPKTNNGINDSSQYIYNINEFDIDVASNDDGVMGSDDQKLLKDQYLFVANTKDYNAKLYGPRSLDPSDLAFGGTYDFEQTSDTNPDFIGGTKFNKDSTEDTERYRPFKIYSTIKWETYEENGDLADGKYFTSMFNPTTELGVGTGFYRAPKYYYDEAQQQQGEDVQLISFDDEDIYPEETRGSLKSTSFEELDIVYEEKTKKFYTPYNGWEPDERAETINDYRVFSGEYVDLKENRFYQEGEKVRVKSEDGYHYLRMGKYANRFLGIYDTELEAEGYYRNRVGCLVMDVGSKKTGIPSEVGKFYVITKPAPPSSMDSRQLFGHKLSSYAIELSFPKLPIHANPTLKNERDRHPVGYKSSLSWTKDVKTLDNEFNQTPGTIAKLDDGTFWQWDGDSWEQYQPDAKTNPTSDIAYLCRHAVDGMKEVLVSKSDFPDGAELPDGDGPITFESVSFAVGLLPLIFNAEDDDITPDGSPELWDEIYINSPEEVWKPTDKDDPFGESQQSSDSNFITNLFTGNDVLREVPHSELDIESFSSDTDEFIDGVIGPISEGEEPRRAIMLSGGSSYSDPLRNAEFRYQNILPGMEDYIFELKGTVIFEENVKINSSEVFHTNILEAENYDAGVQNEPQDGLMLQLLEILKYNDQDDTLLRGMTIEFTSGVLSGQSRTIDKFYRYDAHGLNKAAILPFEEFTESPSNGDSFVIYRKWSLQNVVTSINGGEYREDILNVTRSRKVDYSGATIAGNGADVLLQLNDQIVDGLGHEKQLEFLGKWEDWRGLGTYFSFTTIESSKASPLGATDRYLNIAPLLFNSLVSTNKDSLIKDQEEYPVRHNIINPLVDEAYVTLQINQLFYIYPGDEVKITYKIGALMKIIFAMMLTLQLAGLLGSFGVGVGAGAVGVFNFGLITFILAALIVGIGIALIGDKLTSFSMGTRIDNSGELWPNKIKFRIKYGNLGEPLYSTDVCFYSVVNDPYRKDIKIYLPDNPSNKQRVIKVYKLTRERNPVIEGEQAKRYAADASLVGITEVIKTKLNYPNSVVVGTRVNARDSGGKVPKRSYDLKLKRVKVPSNYSPKERRYEGAWDGTFKGPVWTDNPAWCLYDLISNKSYGLGKFGIQEENIDKWSLYKMGKYCDEMVPTGYSSRYKRRRFEYDTKSKRFLVLIPKSEMTSVDFIEEFAFYGSRLCMEYDDGDMEVGVVKTLFLTVPGYSGYFGVEIDRPLISAEQNIRGYCSVEVDYPLVEPRYSMNALIMQEQNAYKTITEILSIFRSYMYWSEGKIHFFQDEKKDPIMFFNNAGISEEGFTYSSVPRTSRPNKVKVTYLDKNESFKQKIEIAEDKQAIIQNNIVENQIEGFGVTSQSQARRAGEFLIRSANTETELISFKTNIVGSYVKPGDVIEVLDNKRTIGRFAGKIKNTVIDQQGRLMHLYLDYPINSEIDSHDQSTWKKIKIFNLTEFETIDSLNNSQEEINEETGESNIDKLRVDQTAELKVVDISANKERLTIIDNTFTYVHGSFTFEQAMYDAISKGGNLASVGSEQDQMLVHLALPKDQGDAWIGGMYKNGRYEWINPKNYTPEIDYNGWRPGHPKEDESFGDLPFTSDAGDNFDNFGYYVAASSSNDKAIHGTWKSIRGDIKQGYILEKKLSMDDESIFKYKEAKNKSFIIEDSVNMAKPQQYLVESIAEEGKGVYKIQGKLYNVSKFDSIEKDLELANPPMPVIFSNQYIESHRDNSSVELEVVQESEDLVSFALHGKWTTEAEPSYFQLQYIQDGEIIASFEIKRGEKDSDGFYNHSFQSSKIKQNSKHQIRVQMTY